MSGMNRLTATLTVMLVIAGCTTTEEGVALTLDVAPQEIFLWPRHGDAAASADLTVSRIGAGTLSFEATSPSDPWISASPSSGTLTGEDLSTLVTVSVELAALPAGGTGAQGELPILSNAGNALVVVHVEYAALCDGDGDGACTEAQLGDPRCDGRCDDREFETEECDRDPAIGPTAPELCDGVDNDCDGDVDEPFVELGKGTACQVGFGRCASEGTLECGEDRRSLRCDAAAGAAAPIEEICDGIDNDCDGRTDELEDLIGSAPDCALAGIGVCGAASQSCEGGSWEVCAVGQYGPLYDDTDEVRCDGFDNDCDGAVDEGLATVVFPDLDGDGLGDAAAPMEFGCEVPPGFAAIPGDCDDEDPRIGGEEGTPELCDGVDNDCDGFVDAADSDLQRPECPSQAGVCAGGVRQCQDGLWQPCGPQEYGPHFEAPERRCDGLDNDCDGSTDEAHHELGNACVLGVGACEGEGFLACSEDGRDLVCAVDAVDEAAPELCGTGIDEDCDGLVDEGAGPLGIPCALPADDGCGSPGRWSCQGDGAYGCAAEPTFLGRVGGRIWRMRAEGNELLLARDGAVEILDVSAPGRPSLTTSVYTPAVARSAIRTADGDLVAVGDHPGLFTLPRHAVRPACSPTPTAVAPEIQHDVPLFEPHRAVTDVALVGDQAVLLVRKYGFSGLVSVDLGDPSAPALGAELPGPTGGLLHIDRGGVLHASNRLVRIEVSAQGELEAHDLQIQSSSAAVADGRLYVAAGHELQVYSYDDPQAVELLGTARISPNNPESLIVDGSTVYLGYDRLSRGDASRAIQAFDVSAPATPQRLVAGGTLGLEGRVTGLARIGQELYAVSRSGLRAQDLSDPANPAPRSGVLWPVFDAPRLASFEGAVWAADGMVATLDPPAVGDPLRVHAWSEPHSARDVVVGSNGRSYAAAGNGIYALRTLVSEPAPEPLWAGDGVVTSLVAGEGALYATVGNELLVFETTGPALALAGEVPLGGAFDDGGLVAGGRLYLRRYPSELKSFDVTDPHAPIDERFASSPMADFTIVAGRGVGVRDDCEAFTFDLLTGQVIESVPATEGCFRKNPRTLFVRDGTVWVWFGLWNADTGVGFWAPVDVADLGLAPPQDAALPASHKVVIVDGKVALSDRGVSLWNLP